MASKYNDRVETQEVDSKTLYKELTTFIKDSFKPQYTVYQKYMLNQKLQCYKKFESTPAKYFDCIDEIDQKMKTNANLLQQKFSQVDISNQVCQETCYNSFEQDKYRQNCLINCAKTMREQVIQTYNNYYDEALLSSPDYKRLKNPAKSFIASFVLKQIVFYFWPWVNTMFYQSEARKMFV